MSAAASPRDVLLHVAVAGRDSAPRRLADDVVHRNGLDIAKGNLHEVTFSSPDLHRVSCGVDDRFDDLDHECEGPGSARVGCGG